MKTLFLCGAGNSEGVRLALAVERAHHRWDRIVLLDDDVAKHGRALLAVPVTGAIADLAHADPHDEVVSLVARTCARRHAMHERLGAYRIPFATLVHPSVDTDGAMLEMGTTVYAGATIGPEVRIDSGSVVFMGAVVGHESHVGRDCVIAANAVLNARVRLADRVYVGSNATLVPEVSVGADATIGAGSAVVQDVPAASTALGVPAEVFQTGTSSSAAGTPGALKPREPDVHADLRRIVGRAWQEILGAERIGEDENFFDLGGTSLLACHLAERTRTVTGRAVSLVDIFQFPTVRTLTAHMTGQVASPAMSPGLHRAQVRQHLRNR